MALFVWRKIERSGALQTWERKRGWLDVALCLTETQQPKHTDCNMIHSRLVTELHTKCSQDPDVSHGQVSGERFACGGSELRLNEKERVRAF